MDAWPAVMDVIEPIGAVLLLIVLGWAAKERARIHRRWAQLRGAVQKNLRGLRVDWFVAVGAATGWV